MYLRLVIPLGLGGVGGRESLLPDLDSLVGDSSVELLFRYSPRGPSPDISEENSSPSLRDLRTNFDGNIQRRSANNMIVINDIEA